MLRTIFAIFLILIVGSTFSISAFAQTSSFDLKKTSDQYKASGTVSLTKSGTKIDLSLVAKDLPNTLPGGGVYYLAWALTPEGRADNLGTVTNNSELKVTMKVKATQIFVTSEKERYPEFVQGPRIVQTDNIPQNIFDSITTPAPTSSVKPLTSTSPVPIGGPTGAPETGLGGSVLTNGAIISLGGIGITGLFLSLRNRLRKQ